MDNDSIILVKTMNLSMVSHTTTSLSCSPKEDVSCFRPISSEVLVSPPVTHQSTLVAHKIISRQLSTRTMSRVSSDVRDTKANVIIKILDIHGFNSESLIDTKTKQIWYNLSFGEKNLYALYVKSIFNSHMEFLLYNWTIKEKIWFSLLVNIYKILQYIYTQKHGNNYKLQETARNI